MNYIAQMYRFLLIPLIVCITILPSYSMIQGRVENGIPFDYTKINQTETESKAEAFFIKAVNSKTYDNNMISALNLYRMLAEAYPENVIYPLKVGKLYDVIGKDRYAKGYYYRAMNIDKSNPEPYYHLGDFFYKREHYRKALKFYKKSYDRGKNQAKEKINAINAKLDDNSRI